MNPIRSLDVPRAATLRTTRTNSEKRETSQICRDRASADLLRSVAMLNANQRLRLEASAASWTARADMLLRLENGFAHRIAQAAAEERIKGDDPGRQPPRL